MPQEKDIVALALDIAERAHRGQKRKGTGEPYVRHPERVELAVLKKGGGAEDRAAALLHDVLEDTPVSRSDLSRGGIPDEAIRLVELLSRKKDETYADFIMRVSREPRAVRIKLADLEDNMRDLNEGSLKDKYRLAHLILTWGLRGS